MQTKFKVKPDSNVIIFNQPGNFKLEGIEEVGCAPFDRVITFVWTVDEMKEYLQQCMQKQLVAEQGYLFFVYPKKGNKTYEQFIHRDEIFPAFQFDETKYIKDSDYKFASLTSLDETFSILSVKVDGKAKGKKRTASSQRVGDYEKMIPHLRELLAEHAQTLVFYDALTPGYQKDWARYIFSAKKEDTQKARLDEMLQITGQGFKTKELYRKAQSEGSV